VSTLGSIDLAVFGLFGIGSTLGYRDVEWLTEGIHRAVFWVVAAAAFGLYGLDEFSEGTSCVWRVSIKDVSVNPTCPRGVHTFHFKFRLEEWLGGLGRGLVVMSCGALVGYLIARALRARAKPEPG